MLFVLLFCLHGVSWKIFSYNQYSEGNQGVTTYWKWQNFAVIWWEITIFCRFSIKNWNRCLKMTLRKLGYGPHSWDLFLPMPALGQSQLIRLPSISQRRAVDSIGDKHLWDDVLCWGFSHHFVPMFLSNILTSLEIVMPSFEKSLFTSSGPPLTKRSSHNILP